MLLQERHYCVSSYGETKREKPRNARGDRSHDAKELSQFVRSWLLVGRLFGFDLFEAH